MLGYLLGVRAIEGLTAAGRLGSGRVLTRRRLGSSRLDIGVKSKLTSVKVRYGSDQVSGRSLRAGEIGRMTSEAMTEGSLVDRTAFLICDVQERFQSVIPRFDEDVVRVGNAVAEAARCLGRPLIVSEQYPNGLGRTVEGLDVTGASVVEKTKFSMAIPRVCELLETSDSVVLCGIEAHVCILQTALELRTMGKTVYLLVDGVASQRALDRDVALQRMQGEQGIILTTLESVLLFLLGDARHLSFKPIQKVCLDYKSKLPDP